MTTNEPRTLVPVVAPSSRSLGTAFRGECQELTVQSLQGMGLSRARSATVSAVALKTRGIGSPVALHAQYLPAATIRQTPPPLAMRLPVRRRMHQESVPPSKSR